MTWRQYLELLKPRIALMIALTAITGYGAVADRVDPAAMALLALAMVLGAGASAVFNHVWDRDMDRLMRRTARRPMATGVLRVLFRASRPGSPPHRRSRRPAGCLASSC